MKTIPLTRGFCTKVDDDDYPFLIHWNWCVSENNGLFYAVRTQKVNGVKHTIYMHRVIAGAATRQKVDHKNHDTLDNQRSNLRVCEHWQNRGNTKLPVNNSSGYKGVRRIQTERMKSVCYQAKINCRRREFSLGYFPTALQAAKAYDAAAIEHFGEFALTNKQLGLYA